jgi:Uma2 family endonuclease
MSTARRLHYSYAEYLSALEMSEVKLEYCDGEIYAMAGGTIAHSALAARVARIMGNQRKECEVLTSDAKIRVEQTGLSTFPDVSLVCGPILRSPIDQHAVINPTVLIEVTSKSTEDYDRSNKLSHYKHIPSLQAVLILSHRRPQITIIQRSSSGWSESEFFENEHATIENPKMVIPVREVYESLELEHG